MYLKTSRDLSKYVSLVRIQTIPPAVLLKKDPFDYESYTFIVIAQAQKNLFIASPIHQLPFFYLN